MPVTRKRTLKVSLKTNAWRQSRKRPQQRLDACNDEHGKDWRTIFYQPCIHGGAAACMYSYNVVILRIRALITVQYVEKRYYDATARGPKLDKYHNDINASRFVEKGWLSYCVIWREDGRPSGFGGWVTRMTIKRFAAPRRKFHSDPKKYESNYVFITLRVFLHDQPR